MTDSDPTAVVRLTIDGLVTRPCQLAPAELAAIDARHQIPDVSAIDPKRRGQAVRLAGLLERAGPTPEAAWITLHASRDDFHASIPLSEVRDRALVIYQDAGQPLPVQVGGPFRFYIEDFAACHAAEITECANVKFVDRIEFSAARGYDNRPTEEEEHAELHRRQAAGDAAGHPGHEHHHG